MLLPAYIGQRLSLRPEGGKRPSAGAFVAVTGIALAILIMLLAISVVTGFKKEIRDKVIGFNAQITVSPADSYSDALYTSGIRLTDTLTRIIHRSLPEADITLTVRQPAIFKTDSAFQGIVLKGSSGSVPDEFIRQSLVCGDMHIGPALNDSLTNTVVISRVMADALKLDTTDRITVHFLSENDVRTRRLTISGIYDTHFSDYDRLYAFTPIQFLQRFNHIDSITGSNIELRGLPMDNLYGQVAELESELRHAIVTDEISGQYHISNVLDSDALYFNWLELLDTNVVVIIVLMTLVSAFTLISSLFIIILERVHMIGLLKALGAKASLIRGIFIYMSERLVIRGVIIGNILGIGLILIQRHTHFLHLNPEAYYLSYVPAELNWWYVLALSTAVIVLSFAVLIIPSGAIARMSPAQTLRYE
ncbi:MAG: ABC transporter permease [Muribaculaceae bacterium]|nr:ABC transporter permease [Muribaculaceae bacterium]